CHQPACEIMMSDTNKDEAAPAAHENAAKNPDEWTTGDEPMTGPQRSYLKTLCQEANETFDENLTKAEASKRIDELQQKTGRGKSSRDSGNGGARDTRSDGRSDAHNNDRDTR